MLNSPQAYSSAVGECLPAPLTAACLRRRCVSSHHALKAIASHSRRKHHRHPQGLPGAYVLIVQWPAWTPFSPGRLVASQKACMGLIMLPKRFVGVGV